MKHYLYYDGIDSRDFGIWLASANCFDAPTRDVETVSIPGKNGTLTIDNGRFINTDLLYRAYIPRYMGIGIEEIKNRFMKISAYRRLEDTFRPDVFRMARFIDGFSVDGSDRKGAVFGLKFNCMPQLWLKVGEEEQELRNGDRLYNPCQFDAKPLIRVYGETGILYVGNRICYLNRIDDYIDIDSELLSAYKGTINCNGNIKIEKFPVLSPGETGITWDGNIDRAIIKPRWWSV